MSTLETLEKLTHAWPQSEREELGRRFGIGWTALRYQGTGSVEGLEFLYPFLNDSDAHVRRRALEAVGTVFQGTGAESLEKLSYITKNRDLLIRDRSSLVVGKALAGESPQVILDVLSPAYNHRNDFIRALGVVALGFAAEGRGHSELLPIFAERIADRNSLVATNAISGLGLAFAESGNREAIDLLEPFVPFTLIEVGSDESWRVWHFRWRRAAKYHNAAGPAIAHIGRDSKAAQRVAELLRQYLQPEGIPPKMWFERDLVKREGVRAMSWLLRSKPHQALAEMQFLFTEPLSKMGMGRVPRSAAIWSLPGTFEDSGEEGQNAAKSLLEGENHASVRAGVLSLGIAMQASNGEEALATLSPYLSHANGAVRDVANLAVGFVFQKSGRSDVFALLQTTNMDDRRGASANYPLGVGLLFQGTGDESVAAHLVGLSELKRRRLTRHAALGVGLVYQGTSSRRAAELLLPVLESRDMAHACEALHLVDFDEKALERLPRWHSLADGPGAARMFVLKHFVHAPATVWYPWIL